MTITVGAEIRWLDGAIATRLLTTVGASYSTAAKFDHLAAKWPKEAWSLIVEHARPTKETDTVVADIRLLAGCAGPQYLLTVGQRFELYEGRRKVAIGTVIG